MDFCDYNNDELSPEEIKLENEIEEIKEKLDDVRRACQDTDFYTKTLNVEPLYGIKLKIRKQLRAHLSKVVSLDWGIDSLHLVTASQDGKLIVWEAQSGNKLHMIPLAVDWVIGCAFSPNLRFVCSGGLDNTISVYDLGSKTEITDPSILLQGHDGYISCLHYQNDDKIISGSGDKSSMLWDIETKKSISNFHGHNGDIICLNGNRVDENMFITGSADRTAKLWDTRINNGNYVQTFVGHELDINGICFFPETTYGFVTAGDDQHCRLWDIRSDQCIGLYHDADNVKGAGTSITVSKSGRLIIAGYDDYMCYVWDLLREEIVSALSGHDNRISAVKTSPDGVAVATASWDKSCMIWSPNYVDPNKKRSGRRKSSLYY